MKPNAAPRLAALGLVGALVALALALQAASGQQAPPQVTKTNITGAAISAPRPSANASTASDSHNASQSHNATQSHKVANTTLLVETASEQLVSQSQLQAEESRQDAALLSVLPPPAHLAAGSGAQAKQAPVGFTGGSANTYMSMARDGSHRYEFGFNTHSQSAPAAPSGKARARLMREESRLEDGTVIGRYGYTDPFNVFRIVQYVAGPDGYLATEDVGALPADDAGSPGSGAKFQLNKQLHKALEQARLRRRSRAPQQRPAESDLHDSASHQSVRFATKINHVVASDGATYATAFRPVASKRPAGAYEPVARPADALELALKRQQQQTRLRSKLPAPIYAPEESAAQPSGEQLEAMRSSQSSWSLSAPGEQSQHPQERALRASPAWSVLHNNYADQLHSTVVIDHSNTGANLATYSAQLAPQVGENFGREAAILRSLRERRRPPEVARTPRMTFGMAYAGSSAPAPLISGAGQSPASNTYTSAVATQHSREFGARTSAPHTQWPPDATHHQPAPVSGSAYDFAGLALSHFNPPLYHPEVHETRMAESEAGAAKPAQTVSFASTVLHSEVAAERDYKPQRVKFAHAAANEPELLQFVASEQHNSTSRAQPDQPKSGPIVGQHQPHKRHKVAGPVLAGEPGAPALQLASEPLRYATRLSSSIAPSALPESLQPGDDMDMDDSEQVAYLSATNATSGASRARMPDRSKKLSTIFKARTSPAASGDESQAGQARIRRPVPVNAKKQFDRLRLEPSSAPNDAKAIFSGAETLHESVTLSSTANLQATGEQQSSNRQHEPSHTQTLASIQKPSSSSKKFGRGNNVAEKQEFVSAPEVSEAPVSARRRPTLREPKRTDFVIEEVPNASSTSRPAVASSAQSADVSIEAVTRAPQMDDSVPTATIIDATNHKAALNKDLYEKIVRIQQEIAQMNRASVSATTPTSTTTTTNRPTTSTTTTTTTTTTPEPTSTIFADTTTFQTPQDLTTTTKQITSTSPTTTTTIYPASISSDNVASAPKPTLVSSIPNQSSESTKIEPIFRPPTVSMSMRIQPVPPATTTTTVAASPITTTTTSTASVPTIITTTTTASPKVPKNHLTGPLVMMDSLTAQDDFLKELSLDMEAFDSTRADVVNRNQPFEPAASNVVPTTIASPSPESATSSTPARTTVRLASNPLPVTTRTTANPTTFTPTTAKVAPSTTTSGPDLQTTALNSRVAIDATGSDISTPSVSSASTNVTPISETVIVAISTTQSSPIQTSTQPVPTTTTSTTTSTTKAPRTTLRPSTRRSTMSPRFGRLVIKQGDKVVARLNGSEPIPDSLIPVGGNGSAIIMPDMPRLGMRRTIRKRMNSTSTTRAPSIVRSDQTTSAKPAQATTTLSPSIQPNSSDAITAAQKPVVLDLSLNQTASSVNDSSVALAAAATATTTTTAPVSQTNANTSTSVGEARSGNSLSIVSMQAAGQSPLMSFRPKKRSLSRGIRSHSEEDLMVSESRTRHMDLESAGSDDDNLRRVPAPNVVNTPAPERITAIPGFHASNVDLRNVNERNLSAGSRQGSAQTLSTVADARKPSSSNWSTRLRDNVTRMPPPNNKLYDPREDLRKLVEKITNIEGTDEMRAGRVADTNIRPTNKPASRSKPELRLAKPMRTSRITKPVASDALDDIPRRSVGATRLQSVATTNATSNAKPPAELEIVRSKHVNETMAAKLDEFKIDVEIPKRSTNTPVTISRLPSVSTVQNTVQLSSNLATPLRSQILTVSNNKTSSPSIMMANGNSTNVAAQSQLNSTSELKAKRSESQSVAYTIPVSPEIEKQWAKLRPLSDDDVATITTNSTASAGASKPQDVRVDSRGHIHVRHNQSITVHVDIEPPRRATTTMSDLQELSTQQNTLPSSNSTQSSANLATSDTPQRRLTGRDTLATLQASTMTGANDLQRLSGTRQKLSASNNSLASARSMRTARSDPVVDAQNLAPRATRPQEASDATGVDGRLVGSQQPVAPVAKRKPRMLCIEVEADPSDIRSQKVPRNLEI